MAFTKQQILDMPPVVVDEYVLEQVMAFDMAANLGSAGGQVTAAESWVEKGDKFPWTRSDGTSAPLAPSYTVWSRSYLADLGLDNLEWMQRITRKMSARGQRLNLIEQTPGTWTAAFGLATAGAPPVSAQIVLPKMEDAVRRAALLAVQV